ncbi:MAG: enoyl-CoA hydratase/isomerase family protein [Candidatus Marinimicrobia bacterium]|nr:enoyl-CoA hydratase/isomerase family protein [Candidatus Neomarinimicrobiota bacterium]
MSNAEVTVVQDSFIAELILNNPPVNALNAEMVKELTASSARINSLIQKREVRVVLLRAEGKHFCAGADLKERLSMDQSDVVPSVKRIRSAINEVWSLKVPVIAVIQGSALGGGLELALAADIRIVADNARLGLKEVTIGIMPGAGGTQRLSRMVGIGRALEWIMTGRDITPEEGLQSGLVNAVVPEENLLEKAREMASVIAGNAPVGVQAAKKAVREGFDRNFEDALDVEWTEYLKTVPTQDRIEGLKAFSEKRSPKYKGY